MILELPAQEYSSDNLMEAACLTPSRFCDFTSWTILNGSPVKLSKKGERFAKSRSSI
jgi:hypothetical protein